MLFMGFRGMFVCIRTGKQDFLNFWTCTRSTPFERCCLRSQAFYPKAMEIYWKHKELFGGLALMMGGFHLLMVFFGVIGI